MRSRWMLPLVVAAIGCVYLGAAWAGGRLQLGLEMCGVMVVAALGLIVARRNETVSGFTTAQARDERFAAMDLRATAFAGTVVILAVLIGFLVDLARGGSGEPYVVLGAIGGVAYLAAAVWLRRRS